MRMFHTTAFILLFWERTLFTLEANCNLTYFQICTRYCFYLDLLLGHSLEHSVHSDHGPMMHQFSQFTEQCSCCSGIGFEITDGSFKHSDWSTFAPAEMQSSSRTRSPSPHVLPSGRIHRDHSRGFQKRFVQEWLDWRGQGRTSIKLGQSWPPFWDDCKMRR